MGSILFIYKAKHMGFKENLQPIEEQIPQQWRDLYALVGFSFPHMGWSLKVPNGYSFKAVCSPLLMAVPVSNTSPLASLMSGKRKG